MESFTEVASQIARKAGAKILEIGRKGPGFELKGVFDLVTEADRSSEAMILAELIRRYPTHSIVGEEGGSHAGTSEYRWFVDPLDGTTNFAHGFPVYNVSIGLQRGDELIAGIIYDPTRDEMFSAERGAGAFLNGQRIRVTPTVKLAESLVATGFPSRKRHQNINIHFYYQLAMLTHGVRRAGAAAIDLAYVACGRLDAFWEFALNPWDMAAGVLLVREAGGTVTDMRGKAFDLHGTNILADNTQVHEEIVELFAEVYRGEVRVPLPQIAPI